MGKVGKTLGQVAGVVAPVLTGGAAAALSPWLYGAAGLSALGGANDAANSAQAAQGAESDALNQAVALAKQLAATDFTQPILDAGKGAIQTFEQNAGGVPNIQALAKGLLGDNISNAMNASARMRSGNLASAIAGLTGAGSQYNLIGQQAGASAQSQLSGVGSLLSEIPNILGGRKTNVATGVGSSGDAKDDAKGAVGAIPSGPPVMTDTWWAPGGTAT